MKRKDIVMINVGLIGAGRIATVHAKTIVANPYSQLVAVADVIPENAEKLVAQFGGRVDSSESIIANPAIDAVLIASSTDTHSDFIEAATASGKAVLCEKPVDLSLERALLCQANVAKTGKPVMIGFNRRFGPNFVALKRASDQGEIGKPELLCLTSFDPIPPSASYIEVSGGLYRDMMIHDFDMAHFLFGEPPVTVHAAGSCLVDEQIGQLNDIDTSVVTMTYRDGRIAVIKNSRRASYGYDQRAELLGSEGLLQVQNVLESTLVKSTTDGVVGAKPTHFFLERYVLAYEAEWNAFVDAILSDTPMPVTLDDGVIALAMAEAACQSLAQGKPVKMADVI
jgi:myo-inositol 2-dehydrogenase/D-chiro-inositol 1-dehydrogenase